MEAEDLAIRFIGYDLLSTIAHQIGDAIGSLADQTKAKSGTMAAAFQGVGKSLMAVGVGMTAVGVGLVAALAAATVHAAAFDSDMVMVHTHAGLAADQVERVSNDLINMAPAVGFGPDALALAFYHVQSASTSLPGQLQSIAGKESILFAAAQLAAIGHADLTDTTNTLLAVLDAYGSTSMTAADAAAQLNAIVGNGNVTLSQFTDAMRGGLLPIAAQAGVQLSSLGAAYGTLTDEGYGASQSATYLRSAIIQMTEPSGPAAKALAAIGLSGEDVAKQMGYFSQVLQDAGVNQSEVANKLQSSGSLYQTLQMLQGAMVKHGLKGQEAAALIERAFGGIRSGAAMVGLMNQLGSLGAKEDLVKNSTKEWSDTWQYFVQHDPSFAIKQLQSTIGAITTALGQAFIPVLVFMLAAVKPFLLATLTWIEHNQKLVAFIGIAVAGFLLVGGIIMVAAGAFLYITGVVMPFLAALGALNPVVLIIIAIIILLIANWHTLAKAIQPIVAAVAAFEASMRRGATAGQSLIQALVRLGVPIQTAVWAGVLLDKVIRTAEGAFKRIVPAVLQAGAAIQRSIPPALLKELWQAFIQISAAIGRVLVPVIGFLVIILGSVLAGVFKGLVGALTAILPAAILVLVGAFQFLSGIINFIVDLFLGFNQIMDDVLHLRFNRIAGDFMAMWAKLKDDVGQIVTGLVNIILGLLYGLGGGILALVGGFISGFVGAFQYLYDTLVGHSIIPDLVNQIESWIGRLPGIVLGALEGLVSTAASTASRIGQAIFNGITSSLGSIGSVLASDISSGLGSASSIAHALGIPGFAVGGIVTQPTLALVGEDEPELIIPRSKLLGFTAGISSLPSSVTGGASVNPATTVNIDGGGSNGRVVELLQKILDALTEDDSGGTGGTGRTPRSAPIESLLYALQEQIYSQRRRGIRGQYVVR